MSDELGGILSQAAILLARDQSPEGCFLSLSSPDPENFENARRFKTTFPASLILSCLTTLPKSQELEQVMKKTAEFLLGQKNESWSYNYYVRQSDDAEERRFPDDLDDTFCALFALAEFNPDLMTGESLAKIIKILLTLETQEGGPYRTWLVPETARDEWKDVDFVVNSNVLNFLSTQKVELPNILKLIEENFEAAKFTSQYYLSEYPCLYFVSRIYRGEWSSRLVDRLAEKQQPDGSWGTPLDTSFALSALINLGAKDHPAVQKALAHLLELEIDQIFKPYAFGIDPSVNGQKYYAASPSVSLAFYLEAIFRASPSEDPIKMKDKESEKFYAKIANLARAGLKEHLGDQSHPGEKKLELILDRDKDKQIILLPYIFKQSLKNSTKIYPDIVEQLALGNLFGWVAFKIYDDLMDGEGDPKYLPAANTCFRETCLIFKRNVPEDCSGLAKDILNSLERANTWEVVNCRAKIKDKKLFVPNELPDFGDFHWLSDRSMGHAIGPMILAMISGASSEDLKNIFEFFKHYIIARQLNDDGHDWEEDLQKGRLTPVTTNLLKFWASKAKIELDLVDDIKKIQSEFWNNEIVNVCETALFHIQTAKQHLELVACLEKKDFLLGYLRPIERACMEALNNRDRVVSFLVGVSRF